MSESIEQRRLVLYIDDEPKNLSSFKSVFRRHYEIYLANSADEGLEIMEKVPIQLVITDQRMPKTTGVEFLEKINNQFPDVTRILLTGYSDLDAIIMAINKGRIFKYISKPWKAEELKETIDHALEIAELKKQNKILIESLQKTNHELDQFVYRSAHDIRGPIANLLVLINLVKMETDVNLIRSYVGLQEQTVKRLDSFIHDIVNYSGNLRRVVHKESVDFKEILDKVLEEHYYTPKSEQVMKETSVKQHGEFISDKERLAILLSNLISNSIRYSVTNRFNPAFVRIEIESDDSKAIIKVIDNGEGIDDEYLDKIFDMFFRASPNARDGSGLGLFICKEVVEKLGGEIFVESQKDKGSTFTIEIPNLMM